MLAALTFGLLGSFTAATQAAAPKCAIVYKNIAAKAKEPEAPRLPESKPKLKALLKKMLKDQDALLQFILKNYPEAGLSDVITELREQGPGITKESWDSDRDNTRKAPAMKTYLPDGFVKDLMEYAERSKSNERFVREFTEKLWIFFDEMTKLKAVLPAKQFDRNSPAFRVAFGRILSYYLPISAGLISNNRGDYVVMDFEKSDASLYGTWTDVFAAYDRSRSAPEVRGAGPRARAAREKGIIAVTHSTTFQNAIEILQDDALKSGKKAGYRREAYRDKPMSVVFTEAFGLADVGHPIEWTYGTNDMIKKVQPDLKALMKNGDGAIFNFDLSVLDRTDYHITYGVAYAFGEKNNATVSSTETRELPALFSTMAEKAWARGKYRMVNEIVYRNEIPITKFLREIWVRPGDRTRFIELLNKLEIEPPEGRTWNEIVREKETY